MGALKFDPIFNDLLSLFETDQTAYISFQLVRKGVNFQRWKVTPPPMLKFNVSNLASLNFIDGIKFQRSKLTFPNSAVEINGMPFRNC